MIILAWENAVHVVATLHVGCGSYKTRLLWPWHKRRNSEGLFLVHLDRSMCMHLKLWALSGVATDLSHHGGRCFT